MAKDEPLKPDTEQQGRQVPLALDLLEPGSDDLQVERVSQKLPQGITAKMLYSDVVRIAWPSLIELTLTQLTSMVDLMMVGGLGPWAITAVGLSVQPRFLSMTMFIAMNVGATALVARYRGAGKPERANEVLRQALLLSLILSVLCGAAGYIYADRLIAFMGAADAETLAGGTVYLRIQMLTLPIFAVTSTITAALRGVGHTRVAMAYNITANVVNVIFNYLLINGHYGFPRLEVAGASLATSIGQVAAFIMAFTVILRGRHYLHLRFRDGFRLQWQHLYNIFNIGIPSMIEQLAMRAGAIIYVRTVASLGTLAYATHQIGMNIQALSFMTGQAFAVSATSLVGQSLGKKRSDMAQSYSNHTRRLGLIISVILGIVFFFFGRQIVSLYTDEPEIIAQGARILKMVALVQPAQSSQFILAGALRGAGDTRATAVVTFLTVLLVRPSLAILAINGLGWGLDGAWVALLIDQLLRSGLILLRYRSGRWKKVRIK
ncbi:MAG: MATE family efflux transporter [Limnochordia bacterium]|jgi:putative MATE family efflux protein|nr:MATE family efflux transporter [Bacillota bacterium]NLL08674.1 MATE family efflux transporter [Bacillota bacterium]HBG10080.1 MATE family efflux transporter [Bacillota bacterium]